MYVKKAYVYVIKKTLLFSLVNLWSRENWIFIEWHFKHWFWLCNFSVWWRWKRKKNSFYLLLYPCWCEMEKLKNIIGKKNFQLFISCHCINTRDSKIRLKSCLSVRRKLFLALIFQLFTLNFYLSPFSIIYEHKAKKMVKMWMWR